MGAVRGAVLLVVQHGREGTLVKIRQVNCRGVVQLNPGSAIGGDAGCSGDHWLRTLLARYRARGNARGQKLEEVVKRRLARGSVRHAGEARWVRDLGARSQCGGCLEACRCKGSNQTARVVYKAVRGRHRRRRRVTMGRLNLSISSCRARVTEIGQSCMVCSSLAAQIAPRRSLPAFCLSSCPHVFQPSAPPALDRSIEIVTARNQRQ